jgi:hypothetical protein
MGADSYYVKYAIKSIVTNCVKVATIRSKSNHIRSTITIVAIRDNIVVVTIVKNNLSTNN